MNSDFSKRLLIFQEVSDGCYNRAGIAIKMAVVASRYFHDLEIGDSFRPFIQILSVRQKTVIGSDKKNSGFDSRQGGQYLLFGHHQR